MLDLLHTATQPSDREQAVQSEFWRPSENLAVGLCLVRFKRFRVLCLGCLLILTGVHQLGHAIGIYEIFQSGCW